MATPTPTNTVPIRPTGGAPSCMNCPVRQLCLPAGLDDEGCASVNRLVERRLHLQRGDALYQMKEPVRDRLFAVRSGAIKSFQLCADGSQRITGFPGEGDMLGLETIGLGEHPGTAGALSDSVVCELSHSRLLAAARLSMPLARQFEVMLSKELARQQNTTLVLSYAHADQKLANFLLSCGWHSARRGGSPTLLQLPMSRQDIGDYLGLTDATVSRLLRQLQRRGCIAVRQRLIDIVNPTLLRAIAEGHETRSLPPPPVSTPDHAGPRQKTAAA